MYKKGCKNTIVKGLRYLYRCRLCSVVNIVDSSKVCLPVDDSSGDIRFPDIEESPNASVTVDDVPNGSVVSNDTVVDDCSASNSASSADSAATKLGSCVKPICTMDGHVCEWYKDGKTKMWGCPYYEKGESVNITPLPKENRISNNE